MITKKEIADRLGVSRTTVSLVLNRKLNSRISEETRQRVLKEAAKIGYKPELQNLICFVLCNRQIEIPHYFMQLQALEQAAAERDLRILFITVGHYEEEYEKMVSVLSSPGIIGAVVAGDFNAEIVKRIQDAEVPFVVRAVTELEEINLISPDHTSAGFDATNYLLGLGHRRIAFFTGELYKLTHSQLLAGYRKAYEEYGLVFDPVLVQISHAERGDDLVQRMNGLTIDYSAIIAANEHMGIEALNELKTLGRKIPEDVSIIAIGGGLASIDCRPTLSVMNGNEARNAQQALDLLQKNINNYKAKPEKIIVKNILIERDSTGPFSRKIVKSNGLV